MSNQFNFEDSFELKLLAFLVRDIEFYCRCLPHMRFDYFHNTYYRDIYELTDKYVDEHLEAIPKEDLKNEIRKMLKERQRKDVTPEEYYEKIDQLFAMDLTGEKYTEDQVLYFARRQNMKKALTDATDRILHNQPLEPILEDVTKALSIGAKEKDEGGAGMFEILEKKIEEPEYLIKPFMKPGEKGYLTAGYKVGKTLMELQLTCCLAKGIPFLGFEVPKPRKVLYIRFELTDYEFSKRLKQIAKAELQTIKTPAWFILQRGFDLTAKDEKDLHWLFRMIDKHQPDLLVFDPLYKLTSLNLADPKSANPMLNAFAKIQKKYPNLSINSAHHMVKLTGNRSGDSWDSSYGPMQFFADMDYEMRLRRVTADDGKSKRFKLDFLTNSTPVDKMELERDEDTLIYKVAAESKHQKKMSLDEHNLKAMDRILKTGGKMNQSAFMKSCKTLSIGREVFERLAKLGKETFGWDVYKDGKEVVYEPSKTLLVMPQEQESSTSVSP